MTYILNITLKDTETNRETHSTVNYSLVTDINEIIEDMVLILKDNTKL